ncbi:septum formation initiator family protein [Patescibacteria group bacterium]|nr:septum formation initiator family protein [Patescibacteria group bacterium]
MIAQFKKRGKKAVSAVVFLKLAAFILILLILGFLAFWNIKIKQTKDKVNVQLAAIEKEIENLEEKNEELKEGIVYAEDEDYIEKVAREQLNLQKSGESVVSFIMPSREDENKGKEWGVKKIGSWFREKWEWLGALFRK